LKRRERRAPSSGRLAGSIRMRPCAAGTWFWLVWMTSAHGAKVGWI